MNTISLEHLSVRYGTKEVLKNVTADLKGGEVVSVIGQNGCGKTTLLKAIAGLVPHSGSIHTTAAENVAGRTSFSYVPQLTHVASRLTVFEMVLLGLVKNLTWRVSRETFDRVDATLHALHIDKLADSPVSSLSGGQKQLVFMAQAFVSQPVYLLLDEPTSALDLRHQLVVMNAARQYTLQTGAVTMMVVHDLLTAARYSDRIMLLSEGLVRIFDTPEHVLRPEILAEVYRVSVSVETTKTGFVSVVPIEPL